MSIKLTSISGLIYRVKDPLATADFYEKLGFLVTKRDKDITSIRLNWFWVDFVRSDKTRSAEGQFTYIGVSDVDATHQEVVDSGFKPLTKPETFTSGRREFVLNDPDGYNLVFFTKTKK